ncbi:MAG TPA: hypothetical protein VGT41_01510 [Candidatus Babeliales bacterium]|nr:hypothetical protein [Candidatus Babeliales bacterium]
MNSLQFSALVFLLFTSGIDLYAQNNEASSACETKSEKTILCPSKPDSSTLLNPSATEILRKQKDRHLSKPLETLHAPQTKTKIQGIWEKIAKHPMPVLLATIMAIGFFADSDVSPLFDVKRI